MPEAARDKEAGSERVKRGLVRAFEVFGTLAVLVNIIAAAASIKRDLWGIAFGYALIAVIIAGALAMHWYAKHQQVPYRWRDEGWGLERWREETGDEDSGRDEDVRRDERD